MTAVSLTNPYAPQPTAIVGATPILPLSQTVTALQQGGAGRGPGTSSDQSGSGAGNGTGTGGSDRTLAGSRQPFPKVMPEATPKSVIEAQVRAARLDEARSREDNGRTMRLDESTDRLRQEADDRVADQAQRAEEAAKNPRLQPPNPLPTAPFLLPEA